MYACLPDDFTFDLAESLLVESEEKREKKKHQWIRRQKLVAVTAEDTEAVTAIVASLKRTL